MNEPSIDWGIYHEFAPHPLSTHRVTPIRALHTNKGALAYVCAASDAPFVWHWSPGTALILEALENGWQAEDLENIEASLLRVFEHVVQAYERHALALTDTDVEDSLDDLFFGADAFVPVGSLLMAHVTERVAHILYSGGQELMHVSADEVARVRERALDAGVAVVRIS